MTMFSLVSVKQRLLGNRASASRHVLCERQGKINEAYKKLQDGWLTMGTKSLLFSLLRYGERA